MLFRSKLDGMLIASDAENGMPAKDARIFLTSELEHGYDVFCGCDNRKADGSCAGHPSREVERGLIVSPKWAELIVSGKKTWEMRSTGTGVRGRIAIIAAGTGTIVGEVTLDGVLPRVTLADYYKHLEHCITPSDGVDASRWPTPWVLSDAVKYFEPIPYNHPKGAVVWVKLKTE